MDWKVLIFYLFQPKFLMSMIMSCLFSIFLDLDQPMEDFSSFDKVMGFYASNTEQMKVFPIIKEEEMEVIEQVGEGYEATTPIMVKRGHPICVASSSSKWAFPYAINWVQ